MEPTSATEAPPLGKGLLALLTAVAGVSVASLYYAQPLLPALAAVLRASPAAVGLVPMLTQVGYAAGLFLFIPLGDAVERRRLILALVATSTLALLGVAAAPGLAALALASVVVGVTAVAPHVALPLAVHLAAPSERGRVIGVVMSGILVGILLARTVSGAVGQVLGWRAVYVLAAAVTAALGVAVRALLPSSPPTASLRYPALLASLGALARTHRDLREASVLAAAGFGAFSVFWTALAFHLAGPPYFHGSGVAGLFGVVGALGALAAPAVGRASDRRGARFTSCVALALQLAAFAVLRSAAACGGSCSASPCSTSAGSRSTSQT